MTTTRRPDSEARAPRRADQGPPTVDDGEKVTLLAFLDYLRAAVLSKFEDVPEPEVRTAGVGSGTTLLGLVKHLAHVERYYFVGEPITSVRRTLRPTRRETVAGLVAEYRDAIARSNAVIEAHGDLGRPVARPEGTVPGPTMRWTLVHMIEETARHAGHVDILREQIDGATGR